MCSAMACTEGFTQKPSGQIDQRTGRKPSFRYTHSPVALHMPHGGRT